MTMNYRYRSASIRSYNRFLKPGALARLRDSRISTTKQSHKSDSNSQISASSGLPPSSPMSHEIDQLQIDESILFSLRTFGPRFLLRKKLVACKSVLVAPASPAAAVTESVMEAAH